MALDPVTPINIETWMNDSNTSNPLSNLARVSAKMAAVLGTLVNLQKLVVEEIAKKIEKIGNLNLKVKSYTNQTDSKPDARAFLGFTAAESLDVLTQMKALGVKDVRFDIWIAVLNANMAANPPVTASLSITNADLSNFSLALQTISESEQNKSQQESLRLQTITNRYTQSNDQASSVIQKDGQNKGTVTNNLRGSGG
ncbi:MAG: hypothetical protein RL404_1323 [Pseudomonadota bacterium]